MAGGVRKNIWFGGGSTGRAFLYFGLYGVVSAGAIMAVFVFVASIKIKHHTLAQLLGGRLALPVRIVVIGLPLSGAGSKGGLYSEKAIFEGRYGITGYRLWLGFPAD